jgi:hypothetical protein
MASRIDSIPLLDPIATTFSKAWHRLVHRSVDQSMGRWSLMYIDPNGELQRAIVDVIGARRDDKTILVRQSPQHAPVPIKASHVVEAIEVPTGRRVIMDRWFAYQGHHSTPSIELQKQESQPLEVGFVPDSDGAGERNRILDLLITDERI